MNALQLFFMLAFAASQVWGTEITTTFKKNSDYPYKLYLGELREEKGTVLYNDTLQGDTSDEDLIVSFPEKGSYDKPINYIVVADNNCFYKYYDCGPFVTLEEGDINQTSVKLMLNFRDNETKYNFRIEMISYE